MVIVSQSDHDPEHNSALDSNRFDRVRGRLQQAMWDLNFVMGVGLT